MFDAAQQPRGRGLREEHSFTQAVAKLGGAKLVDTALETIYEALRLHAEGFDEVPGWEPIRLAKTLSVDWPAGSVPALRIWFEIIDDNTVSLLHVEIAEED